MVIFRSQFSSFKPEIFYNYWKNALFFSVAEISPEKERSLVQDAWKIIVAEELPQKFTPKFVDTLQNQNGNDSQETTTRKKECLSDELRGPKIVKVTYTYKTMKSVRSSIHTFGLETKYSNKKYISFLLDISLLNWTRWWFSVVSMRSNETYTNTQFDGIFEICEETLKNNRIPIQRGLCMQFSMQNRFFIYFCFWTSDIWWICLLESFSAYCWKPVY